MSSGSFWLVGARAVGVSNRLFEKGDIGVALITVKRRTTNLGRGFLVTSACAMNDLVVCL